MDAYTFLQVVWFVLISILWLGYFVLEGFDFGVGMLLRAVGRSKDERRAVIHSIGPIWDGNEVWLLVAGGATFAAFPQWYATLFSGFYLALFLILFGLIIRNVSFEFWGKAETERGQERWEWAMIAGSALPALLWGVGWANIVHGVPIDAQHEYTGNLFDLLHPYALLGGLATLTLFLTHGAIFLQLKTEGPMRERARVIAELWAGAAAAIGTAFLIWTVASHGGGVDLGSAILAGAAVLCLFAAALLARGDEPGRAFAATTGAILTFFLALFVDLFPHTMVSSTNSAFDMTLNQSASSDYTLTVMTVVAVLLVPVVLAYQAWTYWVFRQRVSAEGFGGGGGGSSPLDLVKQAKSDIERARGGEEGKEGPGEPAGAAGP